MHGIFVTGTDTGVGKTHVGTRLVQALRAQGLRVAVRKPVESGCARGPQGLEPADARALQAAAGGWEPLERICPFRLQAPLSPERAARMEGLELGIEQLAAHCPGAADSPDFLLVEGAGGFYSPLTADGLNADLAQRLGLPVLLVVGDRLGCINHALLTLEAVERRGLHTAAVVVNRLGTEEAGGMDNTADLAERCRAPVFATPAGEAPEAYARIAATLLR